MKLTQCSSVLQGLCKLLYNYSLKSSSFFSASKVHTYRGEQERRLGNLHHCFNYPCSCKAFFHALQPLSAHLGHKRERVNQLASSPGLPLGGKMGRNAKSAEGLVKFVT